jgi:hypothetical protein
MGKTSKAHRKKVQARNTRLQELRKKQITALQQSPQQTAAKEKYVANNYDSLTANISSPQILEFLTSDGPQFS